MSAAVDTETAIARELRECYANLTATQSRCNVLLEDCRALRREIAAFAPLSGVVAELGEDERRVLLEGVGDGRRECSGAMYRDRKVAKRLALGAKQYGRLDVQGDRRDWRREAGEEALDCAVYLACEALRGRAP